MKLKIEFEGKPFHIFLNEAIDISIPIKRTKNPNAFYLSQPRFETVVAGDFVGSIKKGGSCNCEDICFNPHGNGTHTECAGHILKDAFYITQLPRIFCFAQLISVPLTQVANNLLITAEALEKSGLTLHTETEAVIIRSLPNSLAKKNQTHSGTNPPYFEPEAMTFLNSMQIKHLLTDLPSLDKEDDSKLMAHHVFFNDKARELTEKTVTEMVYIDNDLPDGIYFLDLQIAGFESDAAPSKPLLFKLHPLE